MTRRSSIIPRPELESQYANAFKNRAASSAMKGELQKADADYRRYAQLNPADKGPSPSQRMDARSKRRNMNIFVGLTIVFLLLLRFIGTNFGPVPSPPALTAPQQEEVLKAFHVRQNWTRLLQGIPPVAIAVVYFNPGFIGPTFGQVYLFFTAFLSLLMICSMVIFQVWRCPWCTKYLGTRRYMKDKDHCQHCGVRLQEGK